jgi:hypothetical protein
MLPEAFSFEGQTLCCEQVPLPQLAQQYSTPLYIYSERALVDAYESFKQACGEHPVQICFAVKANPNLAILQTLRAWVPASILSLAASWPVWHWRVPARAISCSPVWANHRLS